MALPKELSTIKRFGTRYGRTYKHKLALIEREQKKAHQCPYCAQPKVKRIAMGIWKCQKCNIKFTGKAYTISKKKLTAEQLFAEKTEEETKKAVEEETEENILTAPKKNIDKEENQQAEAD